MNFFLFLQLIDKIRDFYQWPVEKFHNFLQWLSKEIPDFLSQMIDKSFYLTGKMYIFILMIDILLKYMKKLAFFFLFSYLVLQLTNLDFLKTDKFMIFFCGWLTKSTICFCKTVLLWVIIKNYNFFQRMIDKFWNIFQWPSDKIYNVWLQLIEEIRDYIYHDRQTKCGIFFPCQVTAKICIF